MTQTLLPPLTRKLHMIVGFSDTCDFLLSVSHCGKFIVASRNDQAHTVPARKLTALFFLELSLRDVRRLPLRLPEPALSGQQ
jgi:hypothetical protein